MIQGENFHNWLKNRQNCESFPPRKFCRIRYAVVDCLQEFPKKPLTGSVNMIHTLCFDVEKKKSCIDVLSKYVIFHCVVCLCNGELLAKLHAHMNCMIMYL